MKAIPQILYDGRKEFTEGDYCPEGPMSDCGGQLEVAFEGPCYCNATSHPPCSRCESSYLHCSSCGFSPDDIKTSDFAEIDIDNSI